MKLLITGAKGQLGQEIQKILKDGKSCIGEIPKVYKNCTLSCLDIDDIDLADKDAVESRIRGFDVIINCAAATNVDRCEENLDEARAGNVLIAENLARAAHKTGAKLVHVSTDYVFDGCGTVPYREEDECCPASVYGQTKYEGEIAVKKETDRYFIVRTAWLYGEFGNNFVKTIASLARKNGEVKVVCDQIGTPTCANDLAHHLLVIAEGEDYGIYHATGNGEPCSWYDFAAHIVEYAKIPARVFPCTTEEFPRPAKRPSYSVLENGHLRRLGKDNMRDWKAALKPFCEKVLQSV